MGIEVENRKSSGYIEEVDVIDWGGGRYIRSGDSKRSHWPARRSNEEVEVDFDDKQDYENNSSTFNKQLRVEKATMQNF